MRETCTRNMPGVGFLISKLFWPVTKLFEYKITGTLGQPRTEELFFLSRLIFAPLHPIKTLKSIFGPDESKPDAKPPE